MVVEIVLMRAMKSSVGLTQGTGISPSTISTRVHSMPESSRIADAVEEFTGVVSTSEQNSMWTCESLEHSPFERASSQLASLSTDILDGENLSCVKALQVGIAAMKQIEDLQILTFFDARIIRKVTKPSIVRHLSITPTQPRAKSVSTQSVSYVVDGGHPFIVLYSSIQQHSNKYASSIQHTLLHTTVKPMSYSMWMVEAQHERRGTFASFREGLPRGCSSGIFCVHADVIIVSTTIAEAKKGREAVLIGEDKDLLDLLVALAPPNTCLEMITPATKTNPEKIHYIGANQERMQDRAFQKSLLRLAVQRNFAHFERSSRIS
ncbi:hypothetical protein PR048_017727 [Dryococelus australis]|uniref:Uncharacterized protein n=1 Tax=Dryococelus australis TaxID=614101 RepID=A0ABQ9HAA9_9NEOP|nr:hypothetical protein PR048_017727 [Dryococelus australis]